MKFSRKKLIGWLPVVVIVSLSLLFVAIPTSKITAIIGTDNVFIFMYLIAFLGSITTFASIPYPLFLISFAAGGFNPLLIGLVAALGVSTSDSLTFLAASKGRTLLSSTIQTAIERVSYLLKNHPRWLTPGLVLYGVLSPLSNDFAVISLAVMRYRYFRVIPFLAIGNLIYNVGIAYLGILAYDWVVNLF